MSKDPIPQVPLGKLPINHIFLKNPIGLSGKDLWDLLSRGELRRVVHSAHIPLVEEAIKELK
jgi:hypothetical protein